MIRQATTYLFVIMALALTSASAQAQSKTLIKFNPFTLPQELDVYISQQISPATEIEIGGGFIYTDYWDNMLNQIKFGQLIPAIDEHQYLNAKGYAARLGTRFYVISPQEKGKAAGTYFEPVLVFKEIWYPSKDVVHNNITYHNRSIKYVSGLQLLIGRQHVRRSVYLDKYLGLGVKAKTYRFDNYQPDSNGDIVNKGTRTTTWLPDLLLGIKIGIDFKRK